MWSSQRTVALALLVVGSVLTAGSVRAQDSNVLLPADSLEYLLEHASMELPDTLVGTRFEGDRTSRVIFGYEDGTTLLVKWAPAPEGGEEFNNYPRYELAAYEIQKLFLDEPDYVVPPTVVRMFPLSWYRTLDEDVEPTFDVGESVLVTLQYFLFQTTDEGVFDEARLASDTTYARTWANANLLTHLIWHSDSNAGNLRISTSSNARVFAVDNGLAFRAPDSNRGTRWRVLQVDRFPAAAVDRLRALTREELDRTLGVLAEFRLADGELVPVTPGENWRPRRGIRERDYGVQIGLTQYEIDDVWDRIRGFLRAVDRGSMETF